MGGVEEGRERWSGGGSGMNREREGEGNGGNGRRRGKRGEGRKVRLGGEEEGRVREGWWEW